DQREEGFVKQVAALRIERGIILDRVGDSTDQIRNAERPIDRRRARGDDQGERSRNIRQDRLAELPVSLAGTHSSFPESVLISVSKPLIASCRSRTFICFGSIFSDRSQ